jgi:hypothetical protein
VVNVWEHVYAVPCQLTTLTGWQGRYKACGGPSLFCIAQMLFLSMGSPSPSSGLRQEYIAKQVFVLLPLISTREQGTRPFQASQVLRKRCQTHQGILPQSRRLGQSNKWHSLSPFMLEVSCRHFDWAGVRSFNLSGVSLATRVDELSRNRTYIRNLEGFCPDPLDDEPAGSCEAIACF